MLYQRTHAPLCTWLRNKSMDILAVKFCDSLFLERHCNSEVHPSSGSRSLANMIQEGWEELGRRCGLLFDRKGEIEEHLVVHRDRVFRGRIHTKSNRIVHRQQRLNMRAIRELFVVGTLWYERRGMNTPMRIDRSGSQCKRKVAIAKYENVLPFFSIALQGQTGNGNWVTQRNIMNFRSIVQGVWFPFHWEDVYLAILLHTLGKLLRVTVFRTAADVFCCKVC